MAGRTNFGTFGEASWPACPAAANAPCFARTGYHAITMADIAAEAGTSKGAPCLCFPGKEPLYVALHVQWDARSARGSTPPPRTCPIMNAAPQADPAHRGYSRRSPCHQRPATRRVLVEARILAAYQPAIAAAIQASDIQAVSSLPHSSRLASRPMNGRAGPIPCCRPG